MTREEVCKSYAVDRYGVIRSPGKFEGCPIWAPFYAGWTDALGNLGVCEVYPADRREFPELEGVEWVALEYLPNRVNAFTLAALTVETLRKAPR